ncbi:MAG: CBS domain-containing protein, partial [Thermomicrobiales bacterium]
TIGARSEKREARSEKREARGERLAMDPAANETVVGVVEIMTRDVVTITAAEAVADAAAAMDVHKISGMPVLDEGGALVGMVSEYDVISKRGKTVADIMSRGVISVGEDAGAEHVADIIGMHGIRRVPVVRDGRLVGIVSRADLMRLSASMRWTCADCGAVERGIRRPDRCVECGSTDMLLSRG